MKKTIEQTLDPQTGNRSWWEQNPMTYDWERTLRLQPGTRSWYEEIDRRFLGASYFAEDAQKTPFGRFLKPELVAGKSVLEVGCGMGTHASLLIGAGARYTAVDLTERAVHATSRRLELYGLNGTVIRSDAEELPFPDASFDFVWSWGVIHHSSSTERCLAEITRVLRPGGRLMLMVYYRPSLVYYLHNGLIRGILLAELRHKSLPEIYFLNTDGFFARPFTKRELRDLLQSDFDQVSISVVGLKAELFPIPRCRLKEFLERITPNALASAILSRCGSMVVVEAAKHP